jgi:hypothetical protein
VLSLGIEIADKDGGAMQIRCIAIFGILALAYATSYLAFFDENRICPGGHCQGGIQLARPGKK